jgi:capsular exopolysaccharide synthesis family protein
MTNQPNEGKLDLKQLFSRYFTKWYYFVISLAIALTVAYFHIKLSKRIYGVSATVLIENENAGNKAAGELLEVIDAQKKYIEVEDQIGLLTSFNMVQKAIARLDFGVSYYFVPDILINTVGDQVIEEKVTEEFPFRVILDPSSNQLLNVPIYIKILSKNKYQVQVQGGDIGYIYNISNNKTLGQTTTAEINKIVNLGDPFKDENLNFKIFLNPYYESYMAGGKKFFFMINNIGNLTKGYQGKISAKPISRDSRILNLYTEGTVPAKEAKFLDTLISVYLETDLMEKQEANIKAIAFINSQLSTVANQLETSKNALTAYQERFGTERGVNKLNAYERLEALKLQKSEYTTRLGSLNNTLEYMISGQDLETSQVPTAAGTGDPIIVDLIRQLDLLYQEKAKLALTMKPDNPLYQQQQEKIIPARNTIIDNLRRLISVVNSSLAQTNQSIVQLENNVYRLPQDQRQLEQLQSKKEYNEQTVAFYEQKRAAAEILLATNAPSKKRVDYAKMVGGGPMSPKTNAIYLIAFLIGVFIPAGAILAYDLVNNTIKSKDDVRGVTNIPVLGLIGHSDSKNGILAKTDNHKSALSEAFRSLRVNLQYLAAGMDQKAIGITSSVSGEGKTFCAINLSTVLALSGKRTVLLDVDLRKPKVAAYLGLKNTTGLSSYLIKSSTLEEIIQPTKVKNFDVISSGPIPPNPVEMIELKEMRDLIAKLKAEYDYVIVDTPPLSFVAEYMILKEYLDANIFVVRANYTKREVLDTINELYESKAINNLSIVINDINFSTVYGLSYNGKANGYYKN